MLVHVSPYLIAIVEEGWLGLDAILEPQGIGGQCQPKTPQITETKIPSRASPKTSSTFGIIFYNDFDRNVLMPRDSDCLL